MEIVLLDKSTIDAQVRVYHAAFNKQAPLEEIKTQWIKKHYENPIENSLIFGAFEGEELVGLNAYLPSCYMLNGEKVYLLQSCESGVLPSQQGKGVWGKVVRYAVEYIEKNTRYVGIIGFPNYRNSYPGFKKMGWKTLFEMNNLILVNNAKNFSKSLFASRKILQFFARIAVIQRIPLGIKALSHSDIKIKECSISDVFWEDVRDKITIDHSDKWCFWKADYKQMHSLSLNQGERLLASCIYGIDHFEGNEVIRLDYFAVTPESNISSRVLLSKVLKYLKVVYPAAAFVRTWTMNDTGFNKDLKKLLFLRSSHPNPFILTEPKCNLADKQWSLSFFDLD